MFSACGTVWYSGANVACEKSAFEFLFFDAPMIRRGGLYYIKKKLTAVTDCRAIEQMRNCHMTVSCLFRYQRANRDGSGFTVL